MDRPASSSLHENLRSMPASAWVLFVGTFVNSLGNFVFPFMILYLTSRGYSAPQAGLALAMYGLGGVGSQVFGGLLADRIGRRNAIGFSMLSASAFTLVLWQAGSLAVIYPVMGLLALVAGIQRPAASALIADVVRSERRVIAYALFRLAINIGWACGLALGGLLADRSFMYLFVGDALTSAAFGLISLVALPHGVRSSRSDERHLAGATRSILADRGFLFFLASMFVGSAVYMQNVSTFPLNVRADGFSNSVYGLLQGLNGALVVLLELPVSAWAQRRSRSGVVGLGGLLVGLAFASLLVAHTVPALVVMVFVWTLGEMVSASPASAFVADRSPERMRGRYQSALGTMFALGTVVGPLAGTAAYEASPDALWIACGVAGVLAAGLAFAAGRLPSPPLVDTPSPSG